MTTELPADLGGGLVLRRAARDDAEALGDFNARTHGGDDPDEKIRAWALDLAEGRHPVFVPGDFLVVVDAATGAIVSSVNLIAQTWSYGGVEFGVGQVELVGTDRAYRRRGLVRRQFDVAHRWCAERGLPVQAIEGIPWYYRQFGYEYGIVDWSGRSAARFPDVPADGAFRVRPATAADLPLLARMGAQAAERALISVVRDEAAWRHELDGHREQSIVRHAVEIIETGETGGTGGGRPVGALVRLPRLLGSSVAVRLCELEPGCSWLDAGGAVLRHLADVGAALATGDQPFRAVEFGLGADHPLFTAHPRLLVTPFAVYAWYLRVPDLAGFLLRIAPVLERRLAASPVAGYTGGLRLNFYTDGLRLEFDSGRLITAEPWREDGHDAAGASFPGLAFLQVLFGHRSVHEIQHVLPDCRCDDERTEVLLHACFPKGSATVWHIG
ncbi:MAG: GNAT family N-acetyltransferase [Euzebyaceae bacterium]|nr:GNAT family N-acetyltransferase [Euzebyaceae bacterium]